jgi:flavin-dependent dehydrogenase
MSKQVLVVGGGPGGSTAATLLARAGQEVTLLEREHFPRYHIGESVAPSCRAIMEFTGVREKVEARGYPVKRGVLLRWGAEADWAVNWRESFGEDIRSWQVDRGDFDQVLLEHAADQGVRVVQGANVRKVRFDGDRAVAADWVDGDGAAHTTGFDTLVDASGRTGLVSARTLGNRRPHDVFRNVAIWAYYRGGSLLPGTPPGGIDVISSPDGWYWVIPLKDDLYSVGFVTHQTLFRQRRGGYPSVRALYDAYIGESETVRGLVAGGTFEGPVRVEQDYSYVADSFCGPGHYSVGDAACFLDPLLSTGVHLAMYSGLLSAASTVAAASGQVSDLEARGFYEALYRNAYTRLFALVSGMYRKYQGRRGYFWLAQQLLRTEQYKPDSAFGAIVAGLSDLDDATTAHATAPMFGVGDAASQAAERAGTGATPARTTTAPMRMDANDLYDAASGLYLVTAPTLGIRRAASVADLAGVG